MTTSSTPLTAERIRARRSIAAAFFVQGALAGTWATTIPSVKQELGLGEGALGVALLGPALGAILTMPLTGALIARAGSRVVTRTTLLLNALTLVMVLLAPSLWWLFVTLVLFGAAGGAMDVAMNSQGVALERSAGRPILSTFHALWSLGGFAGASVGTIGARAGLSPLVYVAIVSGVLMVGGLVATRKLLPARDDRSTEGPLFARPSRQLAVMGAAAFCAMLAEGAALDWSAVYLREPLASGPTAAAAAVAAFSLGMFSGRLAGDGLVAAYGPANYVRGASLVALAGLTVVVITGLPVLAIAGFGVLGAGLSSIVPVVFGRAGHSSGAGARGIAAVASIGYTAFLVGPSLVGGAAELSSLRIALALVLGLLAFVPLLAGHLQG